MSYCQLAQGHPYHGPYHDLEYGFPVIAEAKLFERLSLEIFQAGLSWLTVLKKREAILRKRCGVGQDYDFRFSDKPEDPFDEYYTVVKANDCTKN
ncbi:MAG: DNA-3-methyladenine glycosylase I, partial [SAR324 cluster bacterium]|nr:DNA-3-methyladenine glycosylase I [SAR324 cluster bacterium]